MKLNKKTTDQILAKNENLAVGLFYTSMALGRGRITE